MNHIEKIKLEQQAAKIDGSSKVIHEAVVERVEALTSDLDAIVIRTRAMLEDGAGSITSAELEDLCLQLSTTLYYVTVNRENLYIKYKLAEQQRKVAFAAEYSKTAGTVEQKRSMAILASEDETIIEVMYAAAYNKVDQRVQTATELLNSVKKVLGSRSSRG